MDYFYHHHMVRATLDTGAETNMIRASFATYIGAPITKSTQIAVQADGKSPLSVVGETHLIITRDNRSFTFEGLVVETLDGDLLGGVPIFGPE